MGIRNPQPNNAHLRIYGCRAYALRHKIPRTKKLEPRAHIGYLVGYESTNIYRIWIPSESRVVATRDVTFNETLFYNPNEPALASQLREGVSHLLNEIEIPYPPLPISQEHLELDSDTDDEQADDRPTGQQRSQPKNQPTDRSATSDSSKQTASDQTVSDQITSDHTISDQTNSKSHSSPYPTPDDLSEPEFFNIF